MSATDGGSPKAQANEMPMQESVDTGHESSNAAIPRKVRQVVTRTMLISTSDSSHPTSTSTTAIHSTVLNPLFRKTVHKPKLYWLPVSDELAKKRKLDTHDPSVQPDRSRELTSERKQRPTHSYTSRPPSSPSSPVSRSYRR